MSCWLGGELEAGKPFYVWSSGANGPVEYRIRGRDKELVVDWTRLRKVPDPGGEPMFRGTATLAKGKYAIDFHIGEEQFSALKLTL